MKKLLCIAGCTAFLLPAMAGPGVLSDYLNIYAPNGSIYQQVVATEADELANGPGYIYSINVSGLVDLSQYGNATQLMEPGPGGWVSDVFGIAQVGSDYYLAFSSDTDTLPVPYSGFPNVLPETGAPVDATMYLAPSLRTAGYTAKFCSVPDGGATAALMGMGLLSLAAMRRMIRH